MVAAVFVLMWNRNQQPKQAPITPAPAVLQDTPARTYFALEPDTVIYGPATIVMDTLARITVPGEAFKDSGGIRLIDGRINVDVRLDRGQSFVVNTPVAVAGVRGTRFSVAWIANFRTEVVVETGTVWLMDNSGESITLGPGEAGVVSKVSGPRLSVDDPFMTSRRISGGSSGNSSTERPIDDRPGGTRGIAALEYEPASVDSLGDVDRSRTGTGITAPGDAFVPRGYSSATNISTGDDTAGDAADGEAAEPSAKTLSGEGSWTSQQGFSGNVAITIDLATGTFAGSFSGTNRARADISGRAAGNYSGDDQAGRLEGATEFTVMSGERTIVQSGSVQGIFSGDVIHGNFSGGGMDATYTVQIGLQ